LLAGEFPGSLDSNPSAKPTGSQSLIHHPNFIGIFALDSKVGYWLGIPVKVNADSGGKPNGVPE
jgi:hypothetical protein